MRVLALLLFALAGAYAADEVLATERSSDLRALRTLRAQLAATDAAAAPVATTSAMERVAAVPAGPVRSSARLEGIGQLLSVQPWSDGSLRVRARVRGQALGLICRELAQLAGWAQADLRALGEAAQQRVSVHVEDLLAEQALARLLAAQGLQLRVVAGPASAPSRLQITTAPATPGAEAAMQAWAQAQQSAGSLEAVTAAWHIARVRQVRGDLPGAIEGYLALSGIAGPAAQQTPQVQAVLWRGLADAATATAAAGQHREAIALAQAAIERLSQRPGDAAVRAHLLALQNTSAIALRTVAAPARPAHSAASAQLGTSVEAALDTAVSPSDVSQAGKADTAQVLFLRVVLLASLTRSGPMHERRAAFDQLCAAEDALRQHAPGSRLALSAGQWRRLAERGLGLADAMQIHLAPPPGAAPDAPAN